MIKFIEPLNIQQDSKLRTLLMILSNILSKILLHL